MGNTALKASESGMQIIYKTVQSAQIGPKLQLKIRKLQNFVK